MDEHLGRLLSMTAKVAREDFDDQLNGVGSSLNAYVILKIADLNPGLSQRRLADALGIEAPTLTHHLDRLAADGLLRRVPFPADRRAYLIELTADGKAHLDRVSEYADQADERFRKMFTPRELNTLVALLNRIRDHFTKEADVHSTSG
jgi:MarR family transcriptional regulator, transcriptional regulator for hemolysin